MENPESAPSVLDYLRAPPGQERTSGLTRRTFLRSSAGVTGVALGGWRWLSLVSAPVAAATPVLRATPALAAPAALAAAQVGGANAFLEFPLPADTVDGQLKVTGESQDASHPNTIEVVAAALGAQNMQAVQQSGPAGSGKTTFTVLQITKDVDGASPPLFRLLGEGKPLPEARLYLRHPGATADYVEYRFGMVFVTSIDTAVAATNNVLSETIQMVFGAMEVNYTPDPSGPTATAAWSQVKDAPTFNVN